MERTSPDTGSHCTTGDEVTGAGVLEHETLSAFVAVLGHSRAAYAEFVTDDRLVLAKAGIGRSEGILARTRLGEPVLRQTRAQQREPDVVAVHLPVAA